MRGEIEQDKIKNQQLDMEAEQVDHDLQQVQNEYDVLEKLLVEYAQPIQNLEKDVREAENAQIKALFEEKKRKAEQELALEK